MEQSSTGKSLCDQRMKFVNGGGTLPMVTRQVWVSGYPAKPPCSQDGYKSVQGFKVKKENA